jgi:hypothetical protein
MSRQLWKLSTPPTVPATWGGWRLPGTGAGSWLLPVPCRTLQPRTQRPCQHLAQVR